MIWQKIVIKYYTEGAILLLTYSDTSHTGFLHHSFQVLLAISLKYIYLVPSPTPFAMTEIFYLILPRATFPLKY